MEIPLHRPRPQRPGRGTFEITPASADSSYPPSPAGEVQNPEFLNDRRDFTPQKTRSILNLTSSTLFGIYSGTSDPVGQESSTPWGTGAQTPSGRRSLDGYLPEEPQVTWSESNNRPQSTIRARPKRAGFRGYVLPLVLQTVLLFAFGAGFGAIATRLNKTQQFTPIPVPESESEKTMGYYQLSWGLYGILIGNGLPLADQWFGKDIDPTERRRSGHKRSDSSGSDRGQDSPNWYSAVRSIGAFVGIAFAVRKVPWSSTLQLSSTLALANPGLWYLIDRSTPGFAFSTLLSIVGTIALSLMHPNFVPVPDIHQPAASEQLGVYMWLASILFCTSLCFGAIGRKLQL